MKNYITLHLEVVLWSDVEDIITTSTSEDIGGGEGETPVIPSPFG